MSPFKDPIGEQARASEYAAGYLRRVAETMSRLDTGAIAGVAMVLETARRASRSVFLVGNGGSAATASHLANDLSVGARIEGRQAIRGGVARGQRRDADSVGKR